MRKKINEIKGKIFVKKKDEDDSVVTGKRNDEEWKNLNQRVEDLVNSLEKSQKLDEEIHSIRFVFVRGLFQGLGIVVGSTVFAGFLYYFFVTYLGLEFFKEWTLDYVSQNQI